MDPNTPADFFQGSSKFHTYYSQTKKGGGVIDLGLSLRTIQHETYLPSGQMIGLDGYGELIDWSHPSYNSNTQLKSEKTGNQSVAQGYYNDEEESRGKLAYVKVNLDGLVVGRKVCLLDQGAYSTLALQLDDMFDHVRIEVVPGRVRVLFGLQRQRRYLEECWGCSMEGVCRKRGSDENRKKKRYSSSLLSFNSKLLLFWGVHS